MIYRIKCIVEETTPGILVDLCLWLHVWPKWTQWCIGPMISLELQVKEFELEKVVPCLKGNLYELKRQHASAVDATQHKCSSSGGVCLYHNNHCLFFSRLRFASVFYPYMEERVR